MSWISPRLSFFGFVMAQPISWVALQRAAPRVPATSVVGAVSSLRGASWAETRLAATLTRRGAMMMWCFTLGLPWVRMRFGIAPETAVLRTAVALAGKCRRWLLLPGGKTAERGGAMKRHVSPVGSATEFGVNRT